MELSRLRSNARAKGKSACRCGDSDSFGAGPAGGPSRHGLLLLLLRARLSRSSRRIRHCKAELTKLSGSLYGHWCDRASSGQMEGVHRESVESRIAQSKGRLGFAKSC